MPPMTTGPTVSRVLLGRHLAELRTIRGLTRADVARKLEVAEIKIRRIEAGDVSVTAPDLSALLDLYEIDDEQLRDDLSELRRAGKQRTWWSAYGTFPMTRLLGYEEAATSIRIWEPSIIPGPLHTEAYARHVALAHGRPDAGMDRSLAMHMERQRRIVDGKRDIAVILDEAAIRRPVGGPDVMRPQLAHMLELTASVHILPFSAGAHLGYTGGFWLFGFDEAVRGPLAYCDSPAGNLYMEREVDIDRRTLAWQRLRAQALDTRESARMIRQVIEEL